MCHPPPLFQLFLPKTSSFPRDPCSPLRSTDSPCPNGGGWWPGWLRGLHAGALQEKVASERQRLRDTFEQLQQFLREQEGVLLAQLDRAHGELAKERHEYVSSVSERKSLLDTLIAEIEKKRDQPVVEFLTVRLRHPPGRCDTHLAPSASQCPCSPEPGSEGRRSASRYASGRAVTPRCVVWLV